MHPRFLLSAGRIRLNGTDAAVPANWAVSARPIRGPAGAYPNGGGPSPGRPGYRTGPQIMAKYVFSFRVPSGYRPNAGTPTEWQAWFGGLGSALGGVGHAGTGYASLREGRGGRRR